MKLLNTTLITGLAFAAMLVSCKPIYKCGDPMPEKMKGGKRLKAVTMERDSLCSALSAEKTTNAQLSSENGTLRKKLSGQENINDMQANQLDANAKDLRNKEMMLRQLEEIIARQDAAARKLNSILRDALTGFNSDELTMEIRDGKVYVSMSDKLLFKSASTAVEPKGVEALKVLADVLNKNPDIQILVEGHTDNVPIHTAQFKDNWDLSVARATSITRLLTEKYGIASTRVTASGRGEFFPKASNDTPEGRAKNRRTEIILSPKLDEIMNLLNNSNNMNTPANTGK